MDNDQILYFISARGGASVPEIMHAFDLSYAYARSLVNMFIHMGAVEFDGGLIFKATKRGKRYADDYMNKVRFEQKVKDMCRSLENEPSEQESEPSFDGMSDEEARAERTRVKWRGITRELYKHEPADAQTEIDEINAALDRMTADSFAALEAEKRENERREREKRGEQKPQAAEESNEADQKAYRAEICERLERRLAEREKNATKPTLVERISYTDDKREPIVDADREALRREIEAELNKHVRDDEIVPDPTDDNDDENENDDDDDFDIDDFENDVELENFLKNMGVNVVDIADLMSGDNDDDDDDGDGDGDGD